MTTEPKPDGQEHERGGVSASLEHDVSKEEVGNNCSATLYLPDNKLQRASPEWIEEYTASYPLRIPMRPLTWAEWTGLATDSIDYDDLLKPVPEEAATWVLAASSLREARRLWGQ